ncbi:MAG: usg protein [Rhodospirillaceae bacterium]|jgi:uncharacterized protein Usg
MTALEQQLQGYRLTTAQILYHLPDHPKLLQEFLWQHLDMAPKFPVLRKFLDFWTQNLDGALHSVTVAQKEIIKPAEFKAVGGRIHLH